MWLLITAALAAPPSAQLSGPEGALTWTVTDTATGIRIEGSSPKWSVVHTAKSDLSPEKTVRTEPDGRIVTVTWNEAGVTVEADGKSRTLTGKGLWDADTLDIRLGSEVSAGRTDAAFSVVDAGSGKIYQMDRAKVDDPSCAATACTHVKVQLTGLLRYVGPTWHYWFAPDGALLEFDGPAGHFTSGGAR